MGRKGDADARGQLASEPFAWRTTKDGTVFVTHEGRTAATVRGPAATTLLANLREAPDARAEQLLLARVTGNFKRGNERRD